MWRVDGDTEREIKGGGGGSPWSEGKSNGCSEEGTVWKVETEDIRLHASYFSGR